MSSLGVIDRPSPSHGERREGPIDILLLHYTEFQAEKAIAWLCDPASEVSAHYIVAEDGGVVRCVPEERRAWHAGRSAWGSVTDVNSRSIGIEIVNAGHRGGLPPYPAAQIAALIALCREVVGRHPIPPHRVLAHSDVAPGRKIDPGERFPWGLIAEAGIGHWVEPVPLADAAEPPPTAGPHVTAVQRHLALYGYPIAVTGCVDTQTTDVVAAFQRHFRPACVDGLADRSTRLTLLKLLEALP